MKFNRFGQALVIILIISAPLVTARDRFETWVAWVSDANCGALHTKPGGADCIRKCRRGGASVGHPEWTAQQVALVRESDKTVWMVDNPSALDGLEGQRAKVTVKRHGKANAIHIESVADGQ